MILNRNQLNDGDSNKNKNRNFSFENHNFDFKIKIMSNSPICDIMVYNFDGNVEGFQIVYVVMNIIEGSLKYQGYNGDK